MNPELPYRQDNHYVFPRTPFEVMDDHIALYPEGREFRASIIGLRNLYNDYPFMTLMREFSKFMKLARVEAGDGGLTPLDKSDHEMYFLSGSVMAIHTMTYGAPRLLKSRILNVNPLRDLHSMPDCPEKEQVIEQGVEQMGNWLAEKSEVLFEAQTDEFKEKLLELSIYLCNDIEKPEGRDTMFISGFMFASELIRSYPKNHGPPVV